jgi:competence protein ComEA
LRGRPAPSVAGVPPRPTSARDGPGASPRVLAALGAATRSDDDEVRDPVEWLRQAHEPAGRHRARRHRPSVVSVPHRLRGGRLRVSRSAVVAVITVALVVVIVGGIRVAWAVGDSRPEIIPDPPALSALEPAPTSSPTPEVLVVHVAGQVRRAGIVRLATGDRVVDAVDAAGGATAEADLAAVNLARPVVDGEQVYVPRPGELPPAPASPAGSAAGGAEGPGGAGAVIDLNTADAPALDSLPGVGPVLAERILAWRTEHGRFTSVDELGEVSGIGEKLLAQLSDRVRVGP